MVDEDLASICCNCYTIAEAGGFVDLAFAGKKVVWPEVFGCTPGLFEVFSMHWRVLSKLLSVDCVY